MKFIFRPKADEPQMVTFADGEFVPTPLDKAGNFVASPGLLTFAAEIPFEADGALAFACLADPRFQEDISC